MEIFGPSPEEKKKELLSDILELYIEIINGNPSEVQDSCTAYLEEYRKILKRLEDYFMGDFLQGVPDFIYELIEDIKPKGMIIPKKATEIKRIEMGLKKIMKKFEVEIPEKEIKQNAEKHIPQIYNVLQANQSTDTKINITNEIKVELNNAIREFETEIKKANPSQSKLKELWNIVKKIIYAFL